MRLNNNQLIYGRPTILTQQNYGNKKSDVSSHKDVLVGKSFYMLLYHGHSHILLKRLNVHCTLGNVLKELSEPAGAVIYNSKFKVSFNSRDLFVEFVYIH